MTPVDGSAREDVVWSPLHSPWRWLLAAATVVTAAAHVPVIGPHLHEAPYMGEEFIVLTVACLLLGLAAVICDSPAVYGLTVVTCGLAIVGYVATRLIAFPLLADDVGNWLEPLAVVSVLAEVVALAVAATALSGRSSSQSSRPFRSSLSLHPPVASEAVTEPTHDHMNPDGDGYLASASTWEPARR